MTPRRRDPRNLAEVIGEVRGRVAPSTPLAAVQAAWRSAVGPGISDRADPVSERDGTITVACESASWAQELDLMQGAIVERLNAEIAAAGTVGNWSVRALRVTADRARTDR